ncbi:MAG: hypothetical protein J5716_06665 [Alphaproteobacteria bacterium]|nr:hypothetical protein [Alphaproteobacteria bacterium]
MTADVAIENTVYKIGGFKVDREIVRYIQEASELSGVSFDYMLAKAGHESRFEVNAAAERSSAEGLYQFTSDTWLQQMKLHGAKYGYARLASQIYRDGKGRYRVKNAEDREEILSLRRSPRISALLAAEFAKSNQKILSDQIGGEITPVDLYLAHFMGPSGAVMLLRADKFTPNKFAADLFPDAAMANPPIFYTEKKRMRTVRQVRNLIEDIFQDKINRFTVLPKSLKVWLDKQPKERKSKKSTVVVEAPILKMETNKVSAVSGEAPPPMPKVVESFELAKILPGEGFNLDDEEALLALNQPILEIQADSGHDDTVSADLLPSVHAGYQTKGVTAMEEENNPVFRPEYTADQATFFETDDYLIQAPLPVLMTANISVPEAFDQPKKEIR